MVLKTPTQWSLEKNIYIMDPDGWRGEDAPSFFGVCSEEEFDQRVSLCTVADRDRLREAGWKV